MIDNKITSEYKQKIKDLLPEIIAIRHRIHQNPELSNQEFDTALLVQELLIQSGYNTTLKVGKTGIMALLDSGKPGKTVALRADLDALPMQEENNFSYKSKNENVMHACGHDGHTSALLLVAMTLIKCELNFNGKIKFIFQPAEEGGMGAATLIEEGVLKDPKVDAIFGFHNMRAKAGTLMVKSGCMMAGGSIFTITIKARGGHAAQVGNFIDPIYIGAQIIQALQSIVSRHVEPTDAVVISVTQFHAGTTFNVIPNEATLNGTLRVTSTESSKKVKALMVKMISEMARTFGAEAEITFEQDFPPTINHPLETELVLKTAEQLLRKEQIIRMEQPSMASEDFSLYLEQVPGCFFFIGNGDQGYLHSNTYDFNDEILPIAAEIMANVALEYLQQ